MTTVSPAFLGDLPNTIAAALNVLLPELKECRGIVGRYSLDRLKTESVKAPAVLVSMTRFRQSDGSAGPQHQFDLEMAAFIVTKDTMGLGRDAAASNIAQVIASVVPDSFWELEACGEARSIRVEPIVTTGLQSAKASLWAVTWTQPCVFNCPEVVEPLPITLYVGMDPNVGLGNEAEYEEYLPPVQI